MSDSESDDDLPLSELKKKAAPKKRKAPEAKKKAPAAKRAKAAPAAKKAAPKKVATAKKDDDEKEPKEKKPKVLSKIQRVEEAIKAFAWWEAPDPPEGQAWSTLEHNGVVFAPPYEPHGVKMLYDGQPVELTPAQEEVATFYASMPEDGPQLNPSGGQRETFMDNFFVDFKKVIGKHHVVQKMSKCDFTPISQHLARAKDIRKAASDAEKKASKEAKEDEQLRSGYAIMDGHLEKVGNFRMEPPSLFRGRGKHPKTGTLKQRTEPEQVSINVGANNVPPRCSEAGHCWGAVQHDDSVTWLASWHENVMLANKYVMLAAMSSLKGKSDFAKFNKAMQLKGCIDKVRHDYRANLTSKDERDAQLATTMWLIDVYALRVGGEKGDDEADTVGCCSLRVEHFTFDPAQGSKAVDLEFLGKDSMLFKQTIDFAGRDEHALRVYANIVRFCRNKKPEEQVFDEISPPELNQHLSSIMPGLTAKVFRTYNASETLQDELPSKAHIDALGAVGDKIVAYNEANRKVAILCNHQRTVSAATQGGIDNVAARLDLLKAQKRDLQTWLALLKKKKPDKIDLHSGVDHMAEADEAVRAAKDKKNAATSVEQKVDATQAYDAAVILRKDAQKDKQAELHKFPKMPTQDQLEKRIENWAEKIKRTEIDLRNKDENKEVALGTSKANYCDPRISVAWCKRCDVPLERVFAKTLREKFAWAMAVGPDWRFESVPVKSEQP